MWFSTFTISDSILLCVRIIRLLVALFFVLSQAHVAPAIADEGASWRDYIDERLFYSNMSKVKTPIYLQSSMDQLLCRDGSDEQYPGEVFSGWAYVDFYFQNNRKNPKTFSPMWLSVDFRCGSTASVEDFGSGAWDVLNKKSRSLGNKFGPLKSSRDFQEIFLSTAFNSVPGAVRGSILLGSNIQISGSCKIPGSGKSKKEIASAESCLWNILLAAKKSIDLKALKAKPLEAALEDYQSRLTRDACGSFLIQVNKLLQLAALRDAVRNKMELVPTTRNIQGGIWFGDYVASNPAQSEYYESLKIEARRYTEEIDSLSESDALGSWIDFWIPPGGWEKYRKLVTDSYDTNMYGSEAIACSKLFNITIPKVPRLN